MILMITNAIGWIGLCICAVIAWREHRRRTEAEGRCSRMNDLLREANQAADRAQKGHAAAQEELRRMAEDLSERGETLSRQDARLIELTEQHQKDMEKLANLNDAMSKAAAEREAAERENKLLRLKLTEISNIFAYDGSDRGQEDLIDDAE